MSRKCQAYMESGAGAGVFLSSDVDLDVRLQVRGEDMALGHSVFWMGRGEGRVSSTGTHTEAERWSLSRAPH